MNAELVTTGTELLLGEIVDTNAAYIAKELRSLGLNLYYKTTVGDNRRRMAGVLRQALQRADVVIVTGGLGPTVDDITREAVADATDCPLEQRREIVDRLQRQFASWGRAITENNLRQTFLPATATMIPNSIGTAPGFLVETQQGIVICLPGVPREMKQMMTEWVVPFLRERIGDSARVIVSRTLHTAGIGESAIDEKIQHLMVADNPTVGLAAHLGRADIRIAASAPSDAEARALIELVESELREILGDLIYGVDDQTLGDVVAEMLRNQSATLSVAETNTQGRIANAFEEQNRTIIRQTVQADQVESLHLQLNDIQPYSLDARGAGAAAARLKANSSSDYALVVLGTIDPEEGFWAENRGKSWLGLATPGAIFTHQFGVGGVDEFTSNWLAIYSLDFLRRHLQERS